MGLSSFKDGEATLKTYKVRTNIRLRERYIYMQKTFDTEAYWDRRMAFNIFLKALFLSRWGIIN